MSTLLLKFLVLLEDSDLLDAPNGLLCHRWLPDGRKDAIKLDTEDSKNELLVWFERRGFSDGQCIISDLNRKEVDSSIIPKQAILQTGPLLGELKIIEPSEEDLIILKKSKDGDPPYIDLGKKVLRILCPPLIRLSKILRANYGQYWIDEFEDWNPKKVSIGSYCRGLLLNWSLDDGKNWFPFIPDKLSFYGESRIRRDFSEYFTERDWHELQVVSNEGYNPSLAASILVRAHQLWEDGNLRAAIIESVLAFEVAIVEFARRKLNDGKGLLNHARNSFDNLTMQQKIVIVSTFLGNISTQDIEDAIKIITKRNKIIHEGYKQTDDDKTNLCALVKITTALLDGPKFRFPTINPGNAMMSIEDWEKSE